MCPLSEYLKQMHSILPEHEDFHVSVLDEGFSNKVYQISWQQRPRLVLRVADSNSQAFGVDRDAELAIWKQASARHLTAQLLWHNEGVTASEFLGGNTLSWQVQHNENTLKWVCDSVMQLHRLAPVAHEYDVYALIESWLEQIKASQLEPSVAMLVTQVEGFYRSLSPVPRPTQLVLCHNDLNPKNMLLDHTLGKAWLIDWESAGMNDPLFDLALLAHIQHFSHSQLCYAYAVLMGAKPSAHALECIEAYRGVYVVRELVWLLLRHQMKGTQDFDCLQWYHALLNDPVFNPYFRTE